MPDEVDVRERLSHLTAQGTILIREEGKIRCLACGHRCLIPEGREGVCRVRYVKDDVLRVPFGYVGTTQLDPIEKKPFFHVTPGARALSFGMLGCDYHCPYCQNWETSQVLHDPDSAAYARPQVTTPEELVLLAKISLATMITSTYNEPLITSEWGAAVFEAAREAGLMTSYVSNGNGTAEVLDYIGPHLDAYKVDLKGMREAGYRTLGGRLWVVLDTIRMIVERGIWLEVVTLVIPGFNDSPEELRDAARYLASVSPDIPWHVTAFHDDYKMTDRGATGAASLRRAADIGREEGLRYVYAGNLPGGVGDWEDTRCPACGVTVVARRGYRILTNRIAANGACPSCGSGIPGIWKRGHARGVERAASVPGQLSTPAPR
ncbi:MAG: AmmeMemoRadiSam system radical SAM enzyme [Thermoanaerobaculia bacterium]